MITASVCEGNQQCIMESLELLGHANAATKASHLTGSSSRGSSSDSDGRNASGEDAASSNSSGSRSGWDSSGGNGHGHGNASGSGSSSWGYEQQQLEGSWQQQAAGMQDSGAAPAVQQQWPGGANGASSGSSELTLDLDSWQQIGFPIEVLSAVVACKNGVKRAHLIDCNSDGWVLGSTAVGQGCVQVAEQRRWMPA